MDWIVNASPQETAGGALSPETESAAHAAFREHGCILLRGAFPPAAVEAMHREYVAQFGALDCDAMEQEAVKPPPNRFLRVGRARYDIVVRMIGAFGNTGVFANGSLLKLLGPLLGAKIHLSNFSVVVSHPGAPKQNAHRDSDHLFSEPGVGPNLPVYAVNVAVPLIDVDMETGPTGVWLGSHRAGQAMVMQNNEMKASPLRRGDAMLLDFRTLHLGLPNQTGKPRPILYMVYARPWFFDHANHVSRIPLDLPLEHYNLFPESVRRLLIRAWSYAARTRWEEADGRERARQGATIDRPHPVSPPHAGEGRVGGKVGRNDPCPCGSGKKYKHCHGRAA